METIRHWPGILAGFLLLGIGVVDVRAEEETEPSPWQFTLDFTYVTRYMWYGYDILGDRGAFQPSFEVGYNGIYAGVWGSWADESGAVDSNELDYSLGYRTVFLDGNPYAVAVDLSYCYYDYPHSDSAAGEDGIADGQQWTANASLPQLIPIGDSYLVPEYELAYLRPGVQGSQDQAMSGWVNNFALSYALPIPNGWFEDQALDVRWETAYNDGICGSDSGWSHCTFSLGTAMNWRGISLAPFVAYQISFEDTVNDENEFYTGISLSYSF